MLPLLPRKYCSFMYRGCKTSPGTQDPPSEMDSRSSGNAHRRNWTDIELTIHHLNAVSTCNPYKWACHLRSHSCILYSKQTVRDLEMACLSFGVIVTHESYQDIPGPAGLIDCVSKTRNTVRQNCAEAIWRSKYPPRTWDPDCRT